MQWHGEIKRFTWSFSRQILHIRILHVEIEVDCFSVVSISFIIYYIYSSSKEKKEIKEWKKRGKKKKKTHVLQRFALQFSQCVNVFVVINSIKWANEID